MPSFAYLMYGRIEYSLKNLESLIFLPFFRTRLENILHGIINKVFSIHKYFGVGDTVNKSAQECFHMI